MKSKIGLGLVVGVVCAALTTAFTLNLPPAITGIAAVVAFALGFGITAIGGRK